MSKVTKQSEVTPDSPQASSGNPADATTALAQAIVEAINIAKPKEKKNAFNRKENTPWTPKDGSPKLKLKRKMYQHGVTMDPDFLTNEEIDLLNKVKPGSYLTNWVRITRRKDWGIDIDYPVKTASERMKLSAVFRIHSLSDLLSRCVEEAKDPKKFAPPDDLDD